MYLDTAPKALPTATLVSRLRDNPWLTLVMLMLVNALMSMDRNLPTLLAEPIRLEFGLSDGQLGIFIGLAFALPLGVAGLVLGPLIDRVNRKWFLVGLVSVWSGLTLLTGMAWNYLSLLGARAGLGAAEATGQPTNLSVIGDKFPAVRRGTAIAIFKLGGSLGTLFASGVVAYIAMVEGWRAAFFVAAVPGFTIALIMAWLLVDPERGAMENSAVGREPVPYRTALRFVLRDRVCAPFALGMFLFVFSGSAFSGFAAPFLQRYHEVRLNEIGLFYGIGSALSMISPLIVGWGADRLMHRGSDRLVFFISILALIVGGSAIAVVAAPIPAVSVTSFIAWQILLHCMTTPCYAVLIYVTPPGMRGTVLSLMTVITMSFGYGLGPIASGFASDHIGGPESLRYALLFVVGVSSVAAVIMFWIAATGLRERNRQAASSSADARLATG